VNRTNGSSMMTSGGRYRLGLAVTMAVTLMIATVNAAGTLHDADDRLDPWEPWVWEFTSIAYWIAILPLLWRVAIPLRPPRFNWPMVMLAYLTLSILVSAAHLATLAALRPPIYALLGSHYTADWSWSQITYEYRKDLLVTLMFIGVGVVFNEWAQAANALVVPIPAQTPLYRFEVRDGARTQWFAPCEIEWIEAAGNYVTVHSKRGQVLHRATLSAVEAELSRHGFVRIHRSRVVRLDAVTEVATTASGDFTATLASGLKVAGSRRFRSGLAQATG
jgi:LytTr DNA-binding domain